MDNAFTFNNRLQTSEPPCAVCTFTVINSDKNAIKLLMVAEKIKTFQAKQSLTTHRLSNTTPEPL